MECCPEEIDGARVVRWVEIDPARHRKTEAIRLIRDGCEQLVFSGLAIATYDKQCEEACDHYLFYCDSTWETMNDSLYASLDEALEEAQLQFQVERSEWRTFAKSD